MVKYRFFVLKNRTRRIHVLILSSVSHECIYKGKKNIIFVVWVQNKMILENEKNVEDG
jgi:hypothetical protein